MQPKDSDGGDRPRILPSIQPSPIVLLLAPNINEPEGRLSTFTLLSYVRHCACSSTEEWLLLVSYHGVDQRFKFHPQLDDTLAPYCSDLVPSLIRNAHRNLTATFSFSQQVRRQWHLDKKQLSELSNLERVGNCPRRNGIWDNRCRGGIRLGAAIIFDAKDILHISAMSLRTDKGLKSTVKKSKTADEFTFLVTLW